MRRRRRDTSLRLEIARMVFGIAGLRREARAWVRERYRPFLARKRASVTIALEAVERSARLRRRPPRLRR